jgi:hypothetical protein
MRGLCVDFVCLDGVVLYPERIAVPFHFFFIFYIYSNYYYYYYLVLYTSVFQFYLSLESVFKVCDLHC